MEEENNNIEQIQTHKFTSYAGVTFNNVSRAYYFGVDGIELNEGDKVVVETVRGVEIGTVAFAPTDISKYKSELALKPIIRKATNIDLRMQESNEKDAVFALEICKQEVEKLNLDMKLLSCEYVLDRTKIIFSYVADERVDFRELLKVLASKFRTRIELRQIGARDKAKMVGGIGMCGLPLCCSTFLNEFDGISISRAKNQMLSINIPKLSGQCGKLMCCLKYEDEAYTELKVGFPDIGTKVFIDKTEFTVTSINVISRKLRLDNEEDTKFLTLEEFNKQIYRRKPKNNNEQN